MLGLTALAIFSLGKLTDLSGADINAKDSLPDSLFAVVDESLSIFSASFPTHLEPSKVYIG
jgi:hypothetical protein